MSTWAFIFSFVLAVLLILYIFFWPTNGSVRLFWDVVRNPHLMSDLKQFHREVDQAAADMSGSPEKVEKLVDQYVFQAKSSQDAWFQLRVLAKLGDQAYPRALEILGDPSFRDRLVILIESEKSLPEGPINRLCEIFKQDAPPPKEAAKLLSPFLKSEHREVRKSVALIIGSIASTDSIPDLRLALADSDEYVRCYALMGIQRGVSGGRINASSRDQIFSLVSGLWPEDTSFSASEKIPQILLKLDSERAVTYLLRDELFNVNFRYLWRILEALGKESVIVPRERVVTVIEKAGEAPIQYPMANVLEYALPLLAMHRESEDLAILERFLNHENDEISSGAVAALYRFHRYHELIRDPWDVVEERGWESLTEVEKHLCAIEELDAEVNNGGFAQYYFNSAGDHWHDALNGLKAIGAKERHRLMEDTVKKIGFTDPSASREARMTQLSKLVRRKEDPFSEQDSGWYIANNEKLDRLLFIYNIANLIGRDKAWDVEGTKSE